VVSIFENFNRLKLSIFCGIPAANKAKKMVGKLK
jgi:hypothetical protein